MANIAKWMLDLINNPKTAKFVETLRHSRLPEGWQNDPEILQLAEQAWKEGGTESPFFKAWFGKSKVLKGDDPRVMHHMTYADDLQAFDKSRQNPGKYGRGFYFSEYPEPIYGNKDIPVYLKSENPAEVAGNRKTKPNIKKLQEQGATGVSIPDKGYQTVFEPEQIKSINNRGTFDPYDSNIYRGLAPVGIGLGTLAAAGMMPDDAEAKVLPTFKQDFLKAVANGISTNMRAGTFEPEAFERLKKIYPDITNDVMVSIHPAEMRSGKNGWSAERTADAISDLLNSKDTDFILNWSDKKKNAKYGAFLPFDIDPLFAPLLETRNNIGLKTVFNPSSSRLEKLGYGEKGGQPLISRSAASKGGQGITPPGTQLQPVSVVTPQPELKNSIRGLDAWVNKKNIPPAILATALGGDAVQAASNNVKEGDWLRQLGLGTRGLLEGATAIPQDIANLINGALGGNPEYFGNAGTSISDMLGLPKAETDNEKLMSAINRGLTEGVIGGGATKLARMGSGALGAGLEAMDTEQGQSWLQNALRSLFR